jgi:hypothetical protein
MPSYGPTSCTKRRALAAALGAIVAVAAVAPVARAETRPAASAAQQAQAPLLTFVPPRVGPIAVQLGPTIIGGQVIDPGLSVSTPGVSLPTLTFAPTFTPPF